MAEKEKIRLFVSVASNRDWRGRFGAAFCGFTSYVTGRGVKSDKYQLEQFFIRAYGQASCISLAKEQFVDEMIAGGFTHWLSLDDDMIFPPDLLDRLVAHDKDVVCANYCHKIPEIKGICSGLDGQNLDSTGKTGLEEVVSMGGCCYLAKIDSFKHIPAPHFEVVWIKEKKSYLSEDVYFSLILRQNGVKIWCDHDLSQEIVHLGEYEHRFPKTGIEKKSKPTIVGNAPIIVGSDCEKYNSFDNIVPDKIVPISIEELNTLAA